jgi:uncharacterized protein YdaU (DUF1376 family)
VNYYKRHIGDYAAATRHLTMLEHGAYTMLLDTYYTSETPLPADVKVAARKAGARSKDEVAAVEAVLAEFFTLKADGWHSTRCDVEIAAYQAKAETNRVVGKGGGRPKKPPKNNHDGFVSETHMVSENSDLRNHPGTLTTNQEPLTINQGGFVEHQQGGPVGPTRAGFEKPDAGAGPGAEAAAAMVAAGVADASATHPKLLALLAAGLTVAELQAAAVYAVGKGAGFAYALARAEGQRRDAVALASLPDAPALGAADPDSRAAIEADAVRLGVPAWQQVDAQGRTVSWQQWADTVRRARAGAVAA